MTNKFIEQRVEALENELSELKLIVAQIRKPSTVVEEALANDIIEFEGKQYKKVDREAREGDVVVLNDVGNSDYFETDKPYKVQEDTYINGVGRLSGNKEAHPVYTEFYNRTSETVDVYELIVEDKPFFVPAPVKTANQLRAEIIEKAKGFIDSQFKKHWNGSGDLVIAYGIQLYSCEFIVNEEKRTVVALLRLYKQKRVGLKGIAKCDPTDVFNEHIGKAIALGRALGLDVSEFEQAVLPNEVVVGMNVIYNSDNQDFNVKILNSGLVCRYDKGTATVDSYVAKQSRIINDTNAQYGGVE